MRKDLPCADCGTLLYRSSTSLPEGKARCQPCRRLTAKRPTYPRPGPVQAWTCEGCGVECSRPTTTGRVPRWCEDCRPWDHYQAAPRACLRCSVSFLPSYAPQRYCSPSCYSRRDYGTGTYSKELVLWVRPLPKPVRSQPVRSRATVWAAGWCQDCGKAFVTYDPQTRYCSERCRSRDAGSRYRAVKRAAFVETVYRYRIYERDKWTCKLCGKRVKRKAVVPDPKAPTLDHIIPLSQGGTHEPANVQCAHFMCNTLKNAGFYLGKSEQPMLLG